MPPPLKEADDEEEQADSDAGEADDEDEPAKGPVTNSFFMPLSEKLALQAAQPKPKPAKKLPQRNRYIETEADVEEDEFMNAGGVDGEAEEQDVMEAMSGDEEEITNFEDVEVHHRYFCLSLPGTTTLNLPKRVHGSKARSWYLRAGERLGRARWIDEEAKRAEEGNGREVRRRI